jgi:hypothetical protein
VKAMFWDIGKLTISLQPRRRLWRFYFYRGHHGPSWGGGHWFDLSVGPVHLMWNFFGRYGRKGLAGMIIIHDLEQKC